MKNFKSILVFLSVAVLFFLGCNMGNESSLVNNKQPLVQKNGITWTNDNAVYAVVHPDYAGQALQDAESGSGAFESLEIKAVFIAGKDSSYFIEPYRFLLVLNNAGKEEQSAAIDKLRADSRIQYAFECNDVPFETENTLYLSASSDTVRVGETLTVKPAGTLKVYQQTFAFDRISDISLANYNPKKKYSPADFPQVNLTSVITHKYSFGTYFTLVLAEPGYFNVFKAIDTLSRDTSILTIGVEGYGFPAVVYSDDWRISDVSVADFSNKEPNGWDGDNITSWYVIPNENGDVTVEALAPGKTTVSYTSSMGWYIGTDYNVTLDIDVLP